MTITNFSRRTDKNIELQTEEAIAGNLLSSAIIKFMEDKDEWTGTATVLLESLEQVATSELKINVSATKQWPKAANALSGRLKEVVTPSGQVVAVDDDYPYFAGYPYYIYPYPVPYRYCIWLWPTGTIQARPSTITSSS